MRRDFNGESISLMLLLDNETLLTMASTAVQSAASGEGYPDFQAKWVLVATWYNVSTDRDASLVTTLLTLVN